MSNSNAYYVDAFLTKRPKEGIAIVEERLKNSMTLDIELAEYFKERAQIEDTYAKSLSRASKRLYTTDPGILGHFAPVWELLLKEFNQVASYHSDMAYKITQDIEKPLRTPPSDEYNRLQQLEPAIQSLENKGKLKGSIFRKSKNVPGKASWKTEGVQYLELHQRVDEARLTRLKTMVEKFSQIQCDQLMKRVEMASITLSSAESFDTVHDVKDFCSERGKGLVTLEQNSSSEPLEKTMQTKSSITSLHDSPRSTNKFKSVFAKKKKSHDVLDQEQPQQQPPYFDMPKEEGQTEITDSTSNNVHLVDAEGYTIPSATNNFSTITSDISSRNTSDDFDSELYSLKLNQRIQVNIKENALQQDVDQNESFNKMANMLRERTPTITRRARGRRENSMQRDSTISSFSTIPDDPRADSITSFASSETNPFANSSSPATSNFDSAFAIPRQTLPSPKAASFQGVTLSDSSTGSGNATSSSFLQSIPEVQHQHKDQSLSIIIREKPSLNQPNLLFVFGQILISCHGDSISSSNVPIQVQSIDGIEQLTPNPQFITVENGQYLLNMSQFSNSDQPVLCFTYTLKTSALALPFRISPSWKCVNDISYLMVKHIKNIVLDASKLKGTIQVVMTDQHVNSVQSTPQGIWDVNKQRLTWTLNDLLEQHEQSNGTQQQRLLAKFYLDGQGTSQPVYLNYQIEDSLISGISVACDALEIKQTETMIQSDHIIYM